MGPASIDQSSLDTQISRDLNSSQHSKTENTTGPIQAFWVDHWREIEVGTTELQDPESRMRLHIHVVPNKMTAYCQKMSSVYLLGAKILETNAANWSFASLQEQNMPSRRASKSIQSTHLPWPKKQWATWHAHI